MSRVESNDEQRIREVQDTQRRQERQLRSADRSARSERSFQDRLQARATTERARHERTTEAQKDGEVSARDVLNRVRKGRRILPHEEARRAAMARALHGKGALEARSKASLGEARIQTDRAEEALEGRGVEREHLDESFREEDTREAESREEGLEAVRRSAVEDAMRVEREAQRERSQEDPKERDDRRDEDERAPAVHETATAKGAAGGPRMPPELLQRIASTLSKIVEDGRTRLRVRLKGPGLDGVELDVDMDDEGIHCRFSGCSDRLRRDLEAAEGELRVALEDRGLELGRLEVR